MKSLLNTELVLRRKEHVEVSLCIHYTRLHLFLKVFGMLMVVRTFLLDRNIMNGCLIQSLES